MQVARIYGYSPVKYVSYETKNTNNQPTHTIQLQDKFSFTGLEKYEKALVGVVRSNFKNETEVTYAFTNLFEEIMNTHFINKSGELKTLTEVFKKVGLRGLLNELWKAYPQKNIENIIKKAETGDIALASHKDKPILELYNLGKQGLLNALTDSQDATRCVGLRFSNPKQSIAAYINFEKDGSLNISLRDKRKIVTTGYHHGTGNKKYETSQYDGARPETTYYNKDGSKAFWKNLFYGGTAIPVW